jgi:2-amino-4-hydroxy-6-hydroxymethyldihydropteridine diphosphokinase
MRHLSSQHLVLGLGSNEQQEQYFRQALDALQAQFGDLIISSVYQSLPVGDQLSIKNNVSNIANLSYYYNAVVIVKSELSIDDIKNITREIENQCGRNRTEATPTGMADESTKISQAVTIDIDCLLYGERTSRSECQSENISLPHENVLTMAYVLRPLVDLLPDVFYPNTKKTFSELWGEMLSQNGAFLEPVDFVWSDQVVSVAPPCLAL